MWWLSVTIVCFFLYCTAVLTTPKIISSFGSEVCATLNTSVSLHCLFNAATMKGTTIVVWLKDHSEISGYENETRPVQGKDNELISILHIINFSHEDQGKYTCYCYYNRGTVTSDQTIISDQVTTYVHTNNCDGGKSKGN